MKLLALDLGDRWIGSAISDGLGITCRPYKTVEIGDLKQFILSTIKDEKISSIIVGKPITFAGKESEQTEKILKFFDELKKFVAKNGFKVKWILWDERLSSKRAAGVQVNKSNKRNNKKLESHSIAAAFILQSYLDSRQFSV